MSTIICYLAHVAMRRLDDDMSARLRTVLVAYGSFLLAEHVLGVSGILAVVGTGLLIRGGRRPDRENRSWLNVSEWSAGRA